MIREQHIPNGLLPTLTGPQHPLQLFSWPKLTWPCLEIFFWKIWNKVDKCYQVPTTAQNRPNWSVPRTSVKQIRLVSPTWSSISPFIDLEGYCYFPTGATAAYLFCYHPWLFSGHENLFIKLWHTYNYHFSTCSWIGRLVTCDLMLVL